MEKQRKCRVCGCTDNDCRQCIEAQGFPCWWVEEDLCSRCAAEEDARAAAGMAAGPGSENGGPRAIFGGLPCLLVPRLFCR